MLCTDRFDCVYTEEVSNSVTQSLCKSLFFFGVDLSPNHEKPAAISVKSINLCESANILHNQHVTVALTVLKML